jgi:hypothetical protein
VVLVERRGEQWIEWDLATAVAALGRSHAALHERAADLDVGDRRVDLKVPPLKRNGLADADARGDQEPEEQMPLVMDEGEHLRQLVAAHRLRLVVLHVLGGQSMRQVYVSRRDGADQALTDDGLQAGRNGAMMLRTVASESNRFCACSLHSHAMNPAIFDGVISVRRNRAGKYRQMYCSICRR